MRVWGLSRGWEVPLSFPWACHPSPGWTGIPPKDSSALGHTWDLEQGEQDLVPFLSPVQHTKVLPARGRARLRPFMTSCPFHSHAQAPTGSRGQRGMWVFPAEETCDLKKGRAGWPKVPVGREQVTKNPSWRGRVGESVRRAGELTLQLPIHAPFSPWTSLTAYRPRRTLITDYNLAATGPSARA